MQKLLVFAVVLMECALLGLLIFVNFFAGVNGLDVYDQVALSLILGWMSILIGYLGWGVYFYNFNYARSSEFWAKFVARAEECAKNGNKTENELYEEMGAPRENPYKDETFGLPPGTVRGTLALTILMGGIALFVSLFSETSPFAEGEFYSYFQFFEDAFLMVIAFYFGTKGLDIVTNQRDKRASRPKPVPPSMPPNKDVLTDEEQFEEEEKKNQQVSLPPKAAANGQSSPQLAKPSVPKIPADVKEQLMNQHYPHVKDTEKDKFLHDEDIKDFAAAWKLEVPLVRSVIKVESSGKGFLQDGRPKILFEGHVFWKQLKEAGLKPEDYAAQHPDILYPGWTKVHYKGGKGEYDRLEKARMIHEAAALSSASWGLFQIMGYHWKNLEYASVEEFVSLQSLNEYEQLEAFGRYIKRFELLDALRNKEWAKFARGYNGKGYAANQYDVKLEKYYHEFSREAAPAS